MAKLNPAEPLIGCTKGVAWNNMLRYVKENFPEGSTEKIRAAITPEDDQILFGKPILPVSWVDYQAYMRFFFMLDQVLGAGDKKMVWDISIWAAQQNLRGIYKVFLSILSPEAVIKNSDMVWKQYYNRGRLAQLWMRNRSNALKLTDFPDIPPGHEWNQLPFMEEAMRLAGAKDVRGKHTQCIARGDDHCLFEFTW